MNKTLSNSEHIFRSLLKKHGIDFEIQKQIVGTPSIFISPNICIFIDNDYQHSSPQAVLRDSQVNLELAKQNYVVLRFRTSEIESNPSLCVSKVKEQILLSKNYTHPFLSAGPDQSEFVSIVKNLRYKKGISQKELGDLVGVPQSAIAYFELGRRMLDFTAIKNIANILGYEGEPYEFYDAKTNRKLFSRILARITANDNRNNTKRVYLVTDSDYVLEVIKKVGRQAFEIGQKGNSKRKEVFHESVGSVQGKEKTQD